MGSNPRGVTEWVAEIGRHHLRPLTLVEVAAVVIALILGWKLVAVAILAWHVLRMAWAMRSHSARDHK